MTSGAHAPAPDEPKPGELVTVDRREAVFLYRRGRAAIVRFAGQDDARVVPFSKLRWPTG